MTPALQQKLVQALAKITSIQYPSILVINGDATFKSNIIAINFTPTEVNEIHNLAMGGPQTIPILD